MAYGQVWGERMRLYQVFFGFFFVVFFGAFSCLDSGYGRPLLPPSLMASKSASVYIPAEPMKSYGSLPFRLRRIFTAAVEISNRFAITETVITAIPILYRQKLYANQGLNAEMLQHCNIILYKRIVILSKFPKIPENTFQNLDCPIGRGYTVYMLQHCNNSGNGVTGSRKGSIGTKGDLDDRTEEFKRMLQPI